MGALSLPTRQRLAKLLPLLSSDKAGEVVATATAIGRTLAAAGADWHVLAEQVERDPEPIVVHLDAPSHPRRPRWQTADVVHLTMPERDDMVAVLRRGRARFHLTAWEDEFADSIVKRLRTAHSSLTARQHEIASRLVAKINARSA